MWLKVGGNGMSPSPKRAAVWLTKAAEQGCPDSQNDLGQCFLTGMGVEQSFKTARKWLRKSADQGEILINAGSAMVYTMHT